MKIPKPRFSIASLLVFIAFCALLFGLLSWQYRTLALARAEVERARMAEELAHAQALFVQPYQAYEQAVEELDAASTSAAEKRLDTSQEQKQRRTTLEQATAAHDQALEPFHGDGAAKLESLSTFLRIKKQLDAIPAIDTHDHLWPFDQLPGYVETDRGRGMNLAGLWRNSYYTWFNPLTPWKPGGTFDEWWAQAKHDFNNARATSFYRYQLPAFQDLYGVDFDRITDDEARELNDRIFENYRDQKWL